MQRSVKNVQKKESKEKGIFAEESNPNITSLFVKPNKNKNSLFCKQGHMHETVIRRRQH